MYVHEIELEFGVLVFKEGGKPENPEENPQSKDENQQQTQPTYEHPVRESNPGHIGIEFEGTLPYWVEMAVNSERHRSTGYKHIFIFIINFAK